MKCPYCGDEMIRGYLMSSRDITFAVDNLTKVFRIKKSDDLELSKGSTSIFLSLFKVKNKRVRSSVNRSMGIYSY